MMKNDLCDIEFHSVATADKALIEMFQNYLGKSLFEQWRKSGLLDDVVEDSWDEVVLVSMLDAQRLYTEC